MLTLVIFAFIGVLFVIVGIRFHILSQQIRALTSNQPFLSRRIDAIEDSITEEFIHGDTREMSIYGKVQTLMKWVKELQEK